MEAGRLAPILNSLNRRLRNPLQLRLILGGSLLAVWYGLVFVPLRSRIDKTARDRAQSEAHLSLARDIEALRTETKAFKGRIPTHADTNEWVEYLLGGVREFPVKMLKLEPKGMRKHGPFEVVALQIELQGSYRDLDAMLAWIEVNPRLLRIDSLVFEPSRGKAETLDLKLTVLGMAN